MAASSDASLTEIPEKKARLTPPNTADGDHMVTEEQATSTMDGASTSHDHDDDVSEISNISGLEDEMQEGRWRPNHGPMAWVQLQMLSGADPRLVLKELLPGNVVIPDHVDSMTLWRLVCEILSDPPRRKKLKDVNTLDDTTTLIKNSKRIMVLTGAGISVSCGIPDFRSKDGIYAKLAKDYPDLTEPQDMFDIQFFSRNPRPFFKFAGEIYPGKFVPSPAHRFIKRLDSDNKLLRNYTQNIDTLEQCAGIKNVIQCHGSFATARCMVCKFEVNSDDIKDDIMKQKIPKCPKCPQEEERAVMKPDIVFFGEGLPEEFHKQMEMDKDQCDLLIVIGSSLKVRPVALIPNSLPANVPQILINREPLRHLSFDVELLGNCDVIVQTLAQRLGWTELFGDVELSQIDYDVIEKARKEEEAMRLVKHDVINDETTCDSVIATINECHICGANNEACSHTSPTPGATAADDVTKTEVKTNDDTASGGEKNEARESDEPSTEPVPHDLDLTGASCDRSMMEERKSLAQYLPPDSFSFLPPNRYLFPGGELLNHNPNANDSDDDEDSSDENESDDNDSPEEKPKHEEEVEKPTEETTQ